MKLYTCNACRYTFPAESLPDRCPDCGKTQWHENPAVRPATNKEIADLFCARADDDECDPVE